MKRKFKFAKEALCNMLSSFMMMILTMFVIFVLNLTITFYITPSLEFRYSMVSFAVQFIVIFSVLFIQEYKYVAQKHKSRK